jgi:hypothetical protein
MGLINGSSPLLQNVVDVDQLLLGLQARQCVNLREWIGSRVRKYRQRGMDDGGCGSHVRSCHGTADTTASHSYSV